MKALVTGVEGSGKSYHVVVYVILAEMLKCRQIVTNIPLNMEIFNAIYPEYAKYITVDDGDYSDISFYLDVQGNIKEGILYIVDEAQEHFTEDKLKSNKLLLLFSRHRKYGLDFYIMTQDKSLLYSKITYVIGMYFSKKRSLGLGGYVCKCHTGKSDRKAPISIQDYKYDQRYFDFYRSYANDNIQEKGTVDGKWYIGLALLVYKFRFALILAVLSFATVNIFAGGHTKKEHLAPVQKPVVESDKNGGLKVDKVDDKLSKPVEKIEKKDDLEGYVLYSLSTADNQIVSCYLRYDDPSRGESESEGPIHRVISDKAADHSSKSSHSMRKSCADVRAVYDGPRSIKLADGRKFSF